MRATTTSANAFNRTYDPDQAPGVSNDQRMASITQLFYTTNYLHDFWYAGGFDEASGNAQTDNYGRGGIAGDNLRAEAQDYSGTFNANMSTPSDGGRPRMQMYLFPHGAAFLLNVNAPPGSPVSSRSVARSSVRSPTTSAATSWWRRTAWRPSTTAARRPSIPWPG
jgi:hypothetical protein